jgi:AcrR family transcriptional regulator
MGVSEKVLSEVRGAKARTRQLMLNTAIELMQQGQTPSVSDVAEAGGVSRATAYRCFPSQAALVQSVVDEALGPLLSWDSASMDAAERVDDLLTASFERILAFESTFKAALKLSLEQWASDRAGTLGEEPTFRRGHRVELLQKAIGPLRDVLGNKRFLRLAQALALTDGLEVLLVLKDLWGLSSRQVQETARWAARALVNAAISDALKEASAKNSRAGGAREQKRRKPAPAIG